METSLDGDLSRELNNVMRDNYGRAGRPFLAHVAANKASVIEQLNAAYTWAIENGVRSEDRFSAWIIAVAKVAGEIARELGVLRFDVTDPCLRAIDATKNQAKEIKTSSERVEDLLTDFVNAHQDHFTWYQTNSSRGWDAAQPRGEVVGRYTVEKGQTVLAVSRKSLTSWARERGIDSQHIARYAKENGIEEKSVKLVQHGKATRCLVITIPEAASQPLHLRLVEAKPQTETKEGKIKK